MSHDEHRGCGMVGVFLKNKLACPLRYVYCYCRNPSMVLTELTSEKRKTMEDTATEIERI